MELTKPKYKQMEVGTIPNDWVKTSLIELADYKKSQFDDGDWVESEHIISDGIRLIQTGNIGIGRFIDKESKKYISEDSFNELNCKEVLEGDLLICRLAEPAGRACVMPNIGESKVITSVDVSIFRGDSNRVNREFLSQLFTTNSWFQKVMEMVGGTTHKRISRGALGKIEVNVPSINEQKAIATVLSDTDGLIQALEKKIAKKKLIKKGVMQRLLTPKEDWLTILLTEAVDYIHGKAHEQEIYENGKYVVVNSKFISTDGAVKKFSDSNFCKARAGDILTVLSDLPNGKALAKCFYVDEDDKYAVNQRICIWRSKSNNYPLFLKYLLDRNRYFLSLDDGVTQTHILNHHIEKCKISIPTDYEEQEKIGTILFDLDKEIEKLERKLSKYQLAKHGMMQQLLTGKIRLV